MVEGNKIQNDVQFFRGIIFMGILLFHVYAPYSSLGWGGVESFFVISSFFLTLKYYNKDITETVKGYISHRWKRLTPSYYFMLIISSLIIIVIRKHIPYDLPFHLLFLQNFLWINTDYTSPISPFTGHTWTMPIEVWNGLIIFILLKNLKPKLYRKVIWIVLVIGIVYRIVAITEGVTAINISLFPLAHIDSFAIGSIVAILVNESSISGEKGCSNNKLKVYSMILFFVGVIGIISITTYLSVVNNCTFVEAYQLYSSSSNYLVNYISGNIYLCLALLTAGIVGVIYTKRNEKPKGKIYNFIVKLGNDSYMLYLFHWPIRRVIYHFTSNWIVLFFTVFIVTITSVYIYRYFEKIFIGVVNNQR